MEGDATEIQKQIENRIAELPADIQNAVLSSDFNEKIQAIGNTYALHIDQMQELGDLTMLVMLGFMKPEEFQDEVRKQFTLPPEVQQKLVLDINTKIFLPIRDSMKRFAEAQNAPAAPAASVPLAQVVPPPVTPPPAAPLPVKTESKLPQINLEQAHTALTQPTVVKNPPVSAPPSPVTPPKTPQTAPPKPQDYKTDPYREPPV